MANPYKKADQTKKVAPGSRSVVERTEPVEPKIEEKIEVEAPVVEEKKPEIIAPVIEEKVTEPVVENSIIDTVAASNILAGMKEKKQRGRSYGFYLDDEVVLALEKLAKQNKTNKSKVLNTLLRNILLK